MQDPSPSEVPRAQADSAYAWAVAVATLLMASLSFGAVTSVPILFTPIAREFGWSNSVIASIYTSTMVCAAIGSIVFGRILDKRGFLLIGLCAGLATGLGLILASHATSLWQMYLAYGLLVGGIGQGVFFSPLVAAVSNWFNRYRSLAVAIALSGQSVGGLLVPPILRIAAENVGWRAALQGYGVLCMLTMVAAVSLYAPKAPAKMMVPTNGDLPAALGSQRNNKSVLLLCAALFCSNTATFGIAGHIVAYGEHIGFGPAAAAGIMAALFGITLLSRLGVGYYLARGGVHRMLLAMSLLNMVGTWLLVTASSPPQLLLAVLVVGFGFGGYLPAYGLVVRNMFPAAEVGRRLTELYFLAFMGAGNGTWLVGNLRDLQGGSFEWGFQTTALVATLACILLLLQRRYIHSGKYPL